MMRGVDEILGAWLGRGELPDEVVCLRSVGPFAAGSVVVWEEALGAFALGDECVFAFRVREGWGRDFGRIWMDRRVA